LIPLGVVKLDRMAIEEAGPDPERIAASIHMQLALLSGPVPIHQVAESSAHQLQRPSDLESETDSSALGRA
jgi:hypothetical protein